MKKARIIKYKADKNGLGLTECPYNMRFKYVYFFKTIVGAGLCQACPHNLMTDFERQKVLCGYEEGK